MQTSANKGANDDPAFILVLRTENKQKYRQSLRVRIPKTE